MPVSYRGSTARKIVAALSAAFPSVPDLDRMVLIVLEMRLNDLVDPAQNLGAVIHGLCTQAEASGKLDALLQGAARENPGNDLLRALHRDLFGSPPEAAAPGQSPTAPEPVEITDVTESCVLGDDIVFVDRESFRGFMRNIHEWSTKRLVVVTGGRKSGKSYSAELIRYGARKLGYETVTVPLAALPRIEPVKALAQAIVAPMQPMALAGGLPGQGKESSARWLHHPLMGWMLGWMKRAEGTWWIVFDDFDHEVLPPEVYDFLADLGERVENDLPSLRLAFLGYDRAIPPQWDNRVRHEVIHEPERSHLVEFFRRLYLDNGLEPHQGTIDFLADEIYQDFSDRVARFAADSADPDLDDDPGAVPMRYLNRKLLHFLTRLRGSDSP